MLVSREVHPCCQIILVLQPIVSVVHCSHEGSEGAFLSSDRQLPAQLEILHQVTLL